MSDMEGLAGLSAEEAARRLATLGPNELPAKRKRTLFHITREVLREPMFMLLLAAGGIYLVLGDPQDASLLLGFVVITMAITIFQERKTERVLETLRSLSSPRALVIRGGQSMRIPGREVVKGDLLVLEEGDRVAADGVLLESHDLLIDESLLTGESVAVEKSARVDGSVHDLASTSDPQHRIYSGSLTVQGGGLALVTATGTETQLGRIGRIAQDLELERSALQREIGMLVKRFSILGTALSLLVLAIYGWIRHDWLNGLLAGITLAMSVLPEEFTVILTVFMALGAWRISKIQVLTRHMPVIEALGSATVLCVDKTGTLTENRMTVKAAMVAGQRYDIDGRSAHPDELHELLKYAVLASEIAPFDPMEKAFHRSLNDSYPETATSIRDWFLAHDYSLTKEWMAMTHVWRVPGQAPQIVATKGAPEAVIRLCRLNAREAASALQQVQTLAADGMRVLAVAKAIYQGNEPWPLQPDAFDFEWIGLVGLEDPLRPQVAQSVETCHRAGIRVVMITGDYPVTAQSIARQAGLPADKVVTGVELEELDDIQRAAVVQDVHVFARILPEQKLSLVQALKANGEIVAMTGDGVNDVPALKAAHIGISMGERGTDVAREAASLVLLNDDFTSIVNTVRYGRRIYENIRKALMFVAAAHVPIAGMTILPLLLGTPYALAPAHIAFIEMIINPASALVFEAENEEDNIMHQPPRNARKRLFDLRTFSIALLQGAGLLTAAAGIYLIVLSSGTPETARAAAFACMVFGNLGLIMANRTDKFGFLLKGGRWNPAQLGISVGAIVALFSVLYLPLLQSVFHFVGPHMEQMLFAVLAGATAIVWFEVVKLVRGRNRSDASLAMRADRIHN